VHGVGVETSVGHGLAALRKAVSEGRSAHAPLPPDVARGLSQTLGARVDDGGVGRGEALALRAAEAALEGVESAGRARTALFVGSGLGPREPWEEALAAALARSCGLGGERATFSVTCVSGLCALEAARAALLLGRAEAALVIGVETLSRTIQGGFCALEALSRQASADPPVRDGILLGEAACALLLRREPPPTEGGGLAILGQAMAADATHVTTPNPEGAGLRRAVLAALAQAELEADELGWIALTAQASPAYAESYRRALTPLLSDWEARAETWEDAAGHLLAASGPLGVAWGQGRDAPGLALTVGFGGLSGAVVVGP
jgi:3-oxoacyl-[acyl-carrier-protein] synthase II